MEETTPTTFTDVQTDVETVIGDEMQEDFIPRIKVKKWDNEVNLSLGIISDEAGEMGSFEDLVRWDTPDMAAVFYPTPDVDEDGGYEFEIHLLSRPDLNVVPLSVQSKGLTFHYQPFEVGEGEERPENVLGSYAAYHESKDGNGYKTGKAFHIYRPWAEDDNGVRVWCEFDPDWDGEGDLNITVPQDFIDNAVYPILIDPTFGYTSVGASTQLAAAGNEGMYGITATGGLGTIQSITYRTASSGTAIKASNAALYKGDDFNKVCESTTTYSIITGANSTWYTYAVTATQITPSPYIIAVYLDLTVAGGGSLAYDTVTNAGVFQLLGSSATADTTMPATGSFTINNNKYSIYANYSAPPITRVTANDVLGTSSTATVSGTYAQATISGNMLVATVYCSSPTGSISISGWTLSVDAPMNGNTNSVAILCKIADGTETSISATCTSSTVSRIHLFEYSGITFSSVANATDTTGSSGNSTSTATSLAMPTVSTTNADDVMIVAYGFSAVITTPSFSGSFAVIQQSVNLRLVTGQRIFSAAGSVGGETLSWTNLARSTCAAVALKQLATLALGRSQTCTGVGGVI